MITQGKPFSEENTHKDLNLVKEYYSIYGLKPVIYVYSSQLEISKEDLYKLLKWEGLTIQDVDFFVYKSTHTTTMRCSWIFKLFGRKDSYVTTEYSIYIDRDNTISSFCLADISQKDVFRDCVVELRKEIE